MNRALLLIDIQNDFCPGGHLEVPGGDAVVGVANQLAPSFELVVATKDWHPANHGSFAANHPWRKPGQVIQLNGLDQILWPIHCVQGSFGSEFHPKLNTEIIDEVFYKGTDPDIDSYSGFFDNGHLKSTGLGDFLKEKGIAELFVCGLATEYCVKFTVLDALELGFKTFVVLEGVKGIDQQDGDVDKALDEMKAKGAVLLHQSEVESRLKAAAG